LVLRSGDGEILSGVTAEGAAAAGEPAGADVGVSFQSAIYLSR
jgi:hypothetical protein